jgi:hypothetical protein
LPGKANDEVKDRIEHRDRKLESIREHRMVKTGIRNRRRMCCGCQHITPYWTFKEED